MYPEGGQQQGHRRGERVPALPQPRQETVLGHRLGERGGVLGQVQRDGGEADVLGQHLHPGLQRVEEVRRARREVGDHEVGVEERVAGAVGLLPRIRPAADRLAGGGRSGCGAGWLKPRLLQACRSL